MKIKLRVASACQWKLLFIAPDVLAHYEQTNRGCACILVLDSLQRVVEPLQSSGCVVQDNSFAKHDITDLPRRRGLRMRPGADDQSLARARFGRRSLLM